MGQYQDKVQVEYIERGYSSRLEVLGLGLSEEAGEVSAAILDMSSEFQPSTHRQPSDLEHELHDCLCYLCAIANSAKIELGI